MDTKVIITVNSVPIAEVNITKIESLKGSGKYHNYRIRFNDTNYNLRHKYSDGVLVMASKALQVIIDTSRGLPTR